MTEETFLESLQDVLEMDQPLSMDDHFREYEEWDSLLFLSLVSYLRSEFHFELTPDLFAKVKTWRDIYVHLC